MKILEYLGRMFCPPQCICCGHVFDFYDNDVFCSECYEQVASRILDVSSIETLKYVDKSYHYFSYNSWYTKKIIRHTKYVGSVQYLDFIGKCCNNSIHKHNLASSLDAITYTPRRPSEVRLYTFDQAREIAMSVSKISGIPCHDYLKRKGFALPQKWMKAKQRQRNAQGKYTCIENIKEKRILLIDDIMTTGSTVNECARLLKENGAKEVYVWTVAK